MLDAYPTFALHFQHPLKPPKPFPTMLFVHISYVCAIAKLSTCFIQVGAVPGYTTGHVEQPGAMQNTYNNYSTTRTQTVYGPAAMTRSPVVMPAATDYMAKTTSIAPGGPALVSHNNSGLCTAIYTAVCCISASYICTNRLLLKQQLHLCLSLSVIISNFAHRCCQL